MAVSARSSTPHASIKPRTSNRPSPAMYGSTTTPSLSVGWVNSGDTILIYPPPSTPASSFSNLDSKAFPPIRCGCIKGRPDPKIFKALLPNFWSVICHMARTHNRNGLRVRCMMVPAVTDISNSHRRQRYNPRSVCQASPAPQRGQMKPCGHRSCTKYSKHAALLRFFPVRSALRKSVSRKFNLTSGLFVLHTFHVLASPLSMAIVS
jgi:hypothetical protein